MRRHAKAPSAGSTSGTGSSRAPFGRTFACLLVLAAFAGSGASAASAAVTPKSVTGFFSATGAAGGQLNTPRGTAVNQSTGNVYTADSSNNRISVFNSSGTFLRAFGQDVVASGPDNNGSGFEICVAANGDVCQKGITTAQTGGAMNAPQGVALDASGNLYVTDQGNIRVQKFDANGNFLLAFGQDVVASGPGNSPATSAVQSLTVTATAGKYTLSFGGKTTPELAFNATAAQVQTALLALSSIGTGNIEVTGASFPYAITFKGALANNPEPTITTASGVGVGNELENGIASLVNTTSGASGFEVCVAANGDVCKTGLTASTSGAFKSTFNGYPAIAPAGSPNAGDVLVADPANLRVQEFSAAGAFVRAFGFDVVAAGPDNSGAAFEVCAAANGDACKIGVTGAGSGQFSNSVNRVAEDAAGNLYTVESAVNFRVQRFVMPAPSSAAVTASGNFSEANLKGAAAASAPLDVAIDPSSEDVLVTKAFAVGTGTPPATVAEKRIVEVNSAGVLQATHMATAAINLVNGIAVRGSTGDVYVASTTEASRLYVLNAPLTAPTATFSGISEVGAHKATVTGFVNPNGPASLAYGLNTSYYFAYKRTADSTFSKAPAVPGEVGRGTSNKLVFQALPALEASTSYDVKLVAERPFGAGLVETALFTFATPAAAAEVGTPSATTAAAEGGARAALWGSITPNSQATTYRFEYGTTADYGTKVPGVEASVGSGGATVPVAQYLSGLQFETTYHFRIVAKNATGSAASPDQTFTTPSATTPGSCPNEAIRAQQGSTYLPDCRAFELVSPADKGPSGSVSEVGGGHQIVSRASEDGDSIVFPIQNGVPNSTAGGWTRWRAQRTSADWNNEQVSTPSLLPALGSGISIPSRVQFASPSLGCMIVRTHSPVTADTPQLDVELGILNLYVWNASDGSYKLITNRVPLNPNDASTTSYVYTHVAASSDCSRVYFRSAYVLLSGASGLYEWDNGVLRDAGVRPNGTVGPPSFQESTLGVIPASAVLGGELTGQRPFTSRWNAVSPNGSRIFFTAIADEGSSSGNAAIFMRENGGARVVELSGSRTGVPDTGARFETASSDGNRVFFRANYGITGASSTGSTAGACGPLTTPNGPNSPPLEIIPCDLYAYDAGTGNLTDLSVDTNPADPIGAAVQGTVAVSDDGSSVYFAALGQLIPGKGKTYAENIASKGSANVYLAKGGQLSYVTTLIQSDLAGGSGSALMHWPGHWSARATADGSRLLFESTTNITGYNNGGGRAAYLYSADTGNVACVSCVLDGSPTQVPQSGVFGGESSLLSLPLQNDVAEDGAQRPSSMSEDGTRVFFTSTDVLAPGAVSGKRNVYEWESGQVSFLTIVRPTGGNGLGQYLDMSASGNDVFVSTADQLTSQDKDFVSDVYDLRVGGGFLAEVPPVPCDPAADACQGMPAAQSQSPDSASSSFQGPGNPPVPKKPKKKAHKKKAHHKPHKKKPHQLHGKKSGAQPRVPRQAANSNSGGAK